RFMVGIPHCLDRQSDRCSDFIFDRSDDRAPLPGTSSGEITEVSWFGASSGTRRLEADFAQSIASAVSQQLDELPLRANQNSFSYMHGLDRNWPGTRAVSLCLFGNLGTIGPAAGSRGNSPASIRILGLGRWAPSLTGNSRIDGSHRAARAT